MKTLSMILTSLLVALPAMADLPGALEQRELVVNVTDALLPQTVQADTESVKAVTTGLFPNGCYSYSKAEVVSDDANKIHEVKTYASVSQGMCLMVLVPFTREVVIGTLSKGEHKVRFLNGDGTVLEKRVVAE